MNVETTAAPVKRRMVDGRPVEVIGNGHYRYLGAYISNALYPTGGHVWDVDWPDGTRSGASRLVDAVSLVEALIEKRR